MLNLLSGQVALVTGGTSGIGKAIAEVFAEQGAKVALIGTNEEKGHLALAEVQQKGEAIFIRADVANLEEVAKAIDAVQLQLGPIQILVNNAGITRDGLLLKMSEKDWDDVLAINLKSCFNTCRTAIRSMLKARRGKIINISSINGLTGNAGQINYCAAKAGMIGFTKALAKEVASRNILVNCLAPGFIDTEMTQSLSEPLRAAITERIPLGKMGTPLDVANAALFLASHLSDYMTGQVLTVDGGLI